MPSNIQHEAANFPARRVRPAAIGYLQYIRVARGTQNSLLTVYFKDSLRRRRASMWVYSGMWLRRSVRAKSRP